MDRGVDIQLAASLRDQDYTLAKLQQMGEAELSGLGIPAHAVKAIRQGSRPAIPTETLAAVLIANRFTCCVCNDSSRRVIVHHIEEWSVSRSHAPENLAVLCLIDHDKAHLRGGLAQNLTPQLLRDFKRRWEEKAGHLPLGAVPMPVTEPSGLPNNGDGTRYAFYQRVSDAEIAESLNRLRQARFLSGFAARDEAGRLADKVQQSELAGGSREVRAKALAWCARILSSGDTLERAKEVLAASNELMQTEEGHIAAAFILANTDKPAALGNLSTINTPAARSAAFRIVINSETQGAALTWADRAGLDEASFDTDGKYAFLLAALMTEAWERLFRAAAAVSEHDLGENAALLHVLAMARLLQAVPVAVRAHAAMQVPPDPIDFPLSAEPPQMENRRAAQTLFLRLADYCRSVGVMPAAHVASDYALWLRLRDPDTRAAGLRELQESLRDPIQMLRRLNLALKFGLALDLAAIEKKLDQSVAFSGVGTADEAFARYALIFAQPGPREAALYIAKHRAQLFEHLQKIPLMGIEIETLARSGQLAAAKERLAEAIGEGMSSHDVAALNIVIAEAAGKDPVAERRALYEQSGELRTLRNLTDALEAKSMWEELLPYAQKLFAETHDVTDCFMVARALDRLDRYGELFAFLSANAALVDTAPNLKAMWAWTLWREGKFGEAKKVLDELAPFQKTASHRALRVNIAISSGNWAALNAYCDEIWADRDQVTAEELLHAVELGQTVSNPHTRELVIAATEKSPTDPAVLSNAYSQATQGGWEQTAQIGGWIQTAAAHSGDDGPIKMVSLKELADQKPAWDRQASDVVKELNAGRLPAFAAADILHRSLMDFTLVPALANPAETDVRKRSLVYAYSGVRRPMRIAAGASIAMELGALFTLARLELLDLVFGRFKIIVPHTTLGWLFRERAKAIFHQPSRIKDAQLLKQLVNTYAISVLTEPPDHDHALTKEIGKELADMLVLAKAQTDGGTPTVVVRSPPLHRLGSLMDEEADIGSYVGHVVSCGAVVDVLKVGGALTAQEEARARAYLRTQERTWPNEPAVDANTRFFLDGLSIAHLRAAGVLAKFKTAGLKVSIAQSDDDEANAFLAMAGLSDEQLAVIERIRAKLEAGLSAGTAQAVRAAKADEDREFQTHPTYAVLALSQPSDFILIDDRALNQHPTMGFEDRITPIVTTLDLLDHLNAAGALSDADLLGHRTTLRQCGYQIIPVTEVELRTHILAATVINGVLIETAELKAIRESLLRARMARIVQLSSELPALQETQTWLIHMIREVWLAVPAVEDAKGRADWLLRLADIRPWASAIQKGQERQFAIYGYAQSVLQLCAAPIGADQGLREHYFAWVTDRVLSQVQLSQPEVYAWLLDRIKNLMIQGVEQGLKEEL
jgi:hypothetical protein